MTGALIAYVRSQRGERGVDEVLARAGEQRPAEELSDTTTWSSYGQALALFHAAADVLRDPDVGRRAGEELLRQYAGTEVAALLRSLGSPSEVLRNVAATAAKYSTVTDMEAMEVTEGRVVISARTSRGITRDRQFCRYTEGVLSQATPLFGLPPATVVELECQTDGGECCLYEVSWDPESSADDDLERKCHHLESELAALTSRFEALQSTSTELVTAESVDALLASVARQAGLAVRAPRHLLAVRMSPTSGLRVHHSGYASDDEARAAAEVLLRDGAGHDAESRLVVDVRTVRREFGRIAAIYPDGGRFFAQERRLLEAYAGHAAAALESAAALEGARRESATARALLELGRALAEMGADDDVAGRLVSALEPVVGCDQGSVLLWNVERDVLELAAERGLPADWAAAGRELKISLDDTPSLGKMITDPTPKLLTTATSDPFLRTLVTGAGLQSVAIVPIVGRGRFFGLVTAGYSDTDRPLERVPDLMERLAGIADHAAVALQNSELLSQVQAQALHDPLTGLPNARLIEDRVQVAINNARRDESQVALMFIDLDRFKPVNDTYGHAAGDAVLVEAAARMSRVVRKGDTVARLAGDEFVVLMPAADSAEEPRLVAERIADVLQRPFDIGDQEVRISGSIGIALYPASGDDYPTLLREADAAMYSAKAQRRPSHAFAANASVGVSERGTSPAARR